ncbi:hypothetical protein D6D01_01121 [Aureobasidium pullulans]|uniref:Uncharacterized protein n=1 Tax=Aureobasidium pullulans TaxID=5580 RepID=A0A4S9M1K0_AURPU|nr:hypothetical protein D6D01_01121 [Aureobasidium pullulans]
MLQSPQHTSRIPLRVDSEPTEQSPNYLLEKELPKTPRLFKPRYLRLNHGALSTILEFSADENKEALRKSRWSIRPVVPEHAELDEDMTNNMQSANKDEGTKSSVKSETSSCSLQPETSFASTKPTSISESQDSLASKPSSNTDEYKEAYQNYRIVSLQSRKQTAAIDVRATIDKTQFLINQIHVSSNPLNVLNSVLHQLSGSSSTLQDLRERIAHQQGTLSAKTETFRLAIRTLLITNQSLIRECEVLLKQQTTSNLEYFTKERLAVHRLLTAFSKDDGIKVDKDDDLDCQRDTLIAFNDYVGSLVESLETQNARLEDLIGEVNGMARHLEEDVNSYVRDKKSLKKMVRKLLGLGQE